MKRQKQSDQGENKRGRETNRKCPKCMQEKNNNRTAGLSLPMPACRNGQRVHWVSWPAPELCTERPGWWNPRCLQTGCWGREREVDRWAEAGRETLLIHSYDQASRCRFSVYDSGLLTLRQAAEYRFDLKVFVCVCVCEVGESDRVQCVCSVL